MLFNEIWNRYETVENKKLSSIFYKNRLFSQDKLDTLQKNSHIEPVTGHSDAELVEVLNLMRKYFAYLMKCLRFALRCLASSASKCPVTGSSAL
jgi:hypothetical protein